MHLAILHYHLNHGGVTQVIANHLRALGQCARSGWPERVAVVYGGRRGGWPEELCNEPLPFSVELIELPSLDYDREPIADPERLAGELHSTLADRGFAADQTVLHCHNHALGKNASLPGALGRLACDGYRVLLQVHDFVEDFRPENYRHLAAALGTIDSRRLAELLYPQAAGIHYAVLTSRDRAVLAAAGVADDRLHLVPNPVAEFTDWQSAAAARPAARQTLGIEDGTPLIVYPTRGIRRKNIGEVLLLAALFRRQATLAVTLAPINPVERVSYDRWRDLSDELGLACRFEVGESMGLSYADILAAADMLVTTSVAEGFGMVFLETWLARRLLMGRNLPEITSDFVDQGIQFPGLYDELSIPREWFDEGELRGEWGDAYRLACEAYGAEPQPDRVLARQMDELLAGGCVDFAVLPPRLQATVIRRAWTDADAAAELSAAGGDRLAAVASVDRESEHDMIAANARLVRRHWSLEAIGGRLVDVYQSLSASEPTDRLEPLPAGRAILNTFLDIRRLHPIRLQ